MTSSQYRSLVERLDNAVDNGYTDVLEQEPEFVYADILEMTGDRTWEDVPEEEIYKAIRGWQERNAC